MLHHLRDYTPISIVTLQRTVRDGHAPWRAIGMDLLSPR
jgi:hypothetical protein